VLLGLLGAFGVMIGTIVVIANLGPGNDEVGGLLALLIVAGFLAWLIMAIVLQATAIRPVEIDDRRGLHLTGVCQEFVDAYREEYGDRPLRVDRRATERWDDRRSRDEDEADDRRRRSRDRYREEDEDERRPPRRDRYRGDEDY
jgi:hypothetical protein